MSHDSFITAALTVLIGCSAGMHANAASSEHDAAIPKQHDSSKNRDASADPHAGAAQHPDATPKPALDRSGRKRVGKASFYARRFAGKTMADGTPMQPHGNNAASKTLPLGTTARVTNIETGQSAVVTIKDRGPYVKGRILDVSPSTAERIGIDHDSGVAKVEVAPIAVPLADGTVKPGVAAGESSKH
jgi:rare lipoprotein A